MRTTITIDDSLLARAKESTGITDKSRLINEALRSIIAEEAGKRVIELGGTMPDLEDIPRRRQDPA